MKISAQVVDCFNYVDDLEENETIENHVELDLLIPFKEFMQPLIDRAKVLKN